MSELKTVNPPPASSAHEPTKSAARPEGEPRSARSSGAPAPPAEEQPAIRTRPIHVNWGFGRSGQGASGE